MTAGMVAQAMRHVGLNGGQLQVTPAPTTLVGYPTRVQVVVADRQVTVSLLGQQVALNARPERVVVDFGDGTTATLHAGQAVDHVYTKAGRVVVHAEVQWTGQFHVPGTDWVDVPGSVPMTGPGLPLQAREAATQLVAS